MSYNFIYKIGSADGVYSENYDTRDECSTGQNKWIAENSKSNVTAIQVQSCNDYSLDDGKIVPVYNINANAEQIKAINAANELNNKDNTTAGANKDAKQIKYTLLEPINGQTTTAITATAFSDYIQSSFNVLFGVFIVWSVFRLAYGGVLFMTSDIINKKIDGKEMIINSIKYISLALITYSIMFFVNPDILDNKITNIIKGGVVTIGRGVGEAVKGTIGGGGKTGVTPKTDGGASAVSSATELLTKVLADEASVRADLAAGGIDIKNGPCNSVGTRGCTNVGLIDDKVVTEIIDLEADCKKYNSKCEVIVSGGTEWFSHGGGVQDPNLNKSKHVPGKYSAQGIDLGLNSYLSGFLKTSGKSLGADDYCYARYEYNGEVYCDEINSARHFHINWKI